MESYLFKTKSKQIGALQREEGFDLIYIGYNLFNDYKIKCYESSNIWLKEQGNHKYSNNDDYLKDYITFNLKHSRNTAIVPPIKNEDELLVVEIKNVNTDKIGMTKIRTCNNIYSDLSTFLMNSNLKDLIDETNAYNNICDSLVEIFSTIYPSKENNNSYGYKIRELLIIACTEVEYLLKMYLLSNGHKSSSLTMKDYFKANKHLRLNEYEIKFNRYIDYPTMSPFLGWGTYKEGDNNFKASQVLSWYNSYNLTKHNRGDAFLNGNIESLINAVGAIHVLLEAQYGKTVFDRQVSPEKSIFWTCKYPDFDLSEVACPYLRKSGPNPNSFLPTWCTSEENFIKVFQ